MLYATFSYHDFIILVGIFLHLEDKIFLIYSPESIASTTNHNVKKEVDIPLHNTYRKKNNNRHAHVFYVSKEEARKAENLKNLNTPQGFTKNPPNAISDTFTQ